MLSLPSGTRVWLACGVTALRKGFDGLAALVQTQLAEDPFSGHVFVFRGPRGDRFKILWWSGDGLCLLARRLERGHFVWPQARDGIAYHPCMLRDAALPDDIAALKSLVIAQRAIIATTQATLIERDLLIGKLRMQFDRSGEQLDSQIAQLELRLEKLEASDTQFASLTAAAAPDAA